MQVEAGLTFNVFLLKSGEVWLSGNINQGGESLIDTENYGGLICLNEVLRENTGIEAKFVKVKAGYSHALLLDDQGEVYTYGSGAYG